MLHEDDRLIDPSEKMLPEDDLQDSDTAQGSGGAQNELSSGGTDKVMTLQRRVYTQKDLDDTYTDLTQHTTLKEDLRSSCKCTKHKVASILLGYVPIVTVLRNYRWKTDLLHDFVSGLSVAFMHMPQGLALGLLASLPPVFGLYSTFYPVLIYFIFGTSRHVSMGTNAVISLLTAGVVETQLEKYIAGLAGQQSALNLTTAVTEAAPILSTEEADAFKVGVAMSLSLVAGAILTALGLLKFGFLTNYLSTSFVGGFTTAAAFHIMTSQISKMLNIKVKPFTGAGKIVKTYIAIFENIDNSNPGDVIVAILSIAFLLSITILVNERYNKKLKVPVPVDLLIVIIATIISHFADLNGNFGIAVVGDIPRGLPSPKLPNTDVLSEVATEAFTLAILIFAMTISMAKLMAKLHDYKIDDNQEFVAYGLCNFISSFFRCLPSCLAPPRTMILSNTGARSTLNGIFSALFILIILLAAGGLFVSLPIAVLAAMICVAVKNLLLQVRNTPELWRLSKPDFIIWTVTCLVSIFVDLDIGVAAGIAVSVMTIIVRGQFTSGSVGSVATKEDLILLDRERDGFRKMKGIQIFYFPSQLYFANAERFKKQLFSKVLNPRAVAKETTEESKELVKTSDINENAENPQPKDLKYILLECSAMTYMDIAGANMLKMVTSQYKKIGVTVVLTRCPSYTRDLLERVGYFKDDGDKFVFVDVYDAINTLEVDASKNSDVENTHI